MLYRYYFNSILLAFWLITISSAATLAEGSQASSRQKLMVINVAFGNGVNTSLVSGEKVLQAAALAAYLSNKYELVSVVAIDSTVKAITASGQTITVKEVAMRLAVDKILSIQVGALKNMIRIDITVYDTTSNDLLKESAKGGGYCLLRYRVNLSDKAIYDPTLLTAMQRSFAAVFGDSAMYADQSGDYRVFPAQSLVISGFYFMESDQNKIWDIYENKILNSFYLTETIFETIRDCPQFAVYDTESRDSLYSLFNLYGVENCNQPTAVEVDALRRMEVKYMISGVIKRTSEGASVGLSLYEIQKDKPSIEGKVAQLKSVDELLPVDSFTVLKKLVVKMAIKLLGL